MIEEEMNKFKTILLILNLLFIVGLTLYVVIKSEVIFLNPCEACEDLRMGYKCNRMELNPTYSAMFEINETVGIIESGI